MKNTTLSTLGAISMSMAVTSAGPVTPVITPKEPDAFKWVTPTLDVMLRLEQRDQDGLDPSTAVTLRERVGLKFGSYKGFSAFVEGEFSHAIGDDYHGGAALSNPSDPSNSPIADPETTELNRAWVQYKGADTTLKLGRQRIKFNGDAIIGNVGWRQNEQTFDAVRLTNTSIDGLVFDYVYSDRVQRIFGNEASGGFEDWEGDFHYVNANYKGIDGLDLTGYISIIDFDPGNANGRARANGETYGVIAKGKVGSFSLYGEVAYQLADLASTEDSLYAHLKASTKLGSHTVGVGYEHLGEDFYTPFATVHAFNGFADVYIVGRLGLAAHDGINDFYAFHSTKLPFGIVWKNWAHYIAAENGAGASMNGWEYDSVLAKKFGNGFSALAKFYHFESEDDATVPTTTGFTLGVGYKF